MIEIMDDDDDDHDHDTFHYNLTFYKMFVIFPSFNLNFVIPIIISITINEFFL